MDRIRGKNLGSTIGIALEEMQVANQEEEDQIRQNDTNTIINNYHQTRDAIANKYNKRNFDKNDKNA